MGLGNFLAAVYTNSTQQDIMDVGADKSYVRMSN